MKCCNTCANSATLKTPGIGTRTYDCFAAHNNKNNEPAECTLENGLKMYKPMKEVGA